MNDTPPLLPTAAPAPFLPELNPPTLQSPFLWLKWGWQSFTATWLPSLFYGLCFTLGGVLLSWTLYWHTAYTPAVMGGFLILAPFLTLGLYHLAQQHEQHHPTNLRRSIIAWRSNWVNMALFCFVLLVIFMVWIRASFVAFAIYYSGPLLALDVLIKQTITQGSWSFLFTYFAVGSIFAALAFAISVITVPMMLEREADTVPAVLTSMRLCVEYPYPMMLWAACLAVLGMLGLISGLLGLLVIGPWLGHATWYAYRNMVKPQVGLHDTQ